MPRRMARKRAPSKLPLLLGLSAALLLIILLFPKTPTNRALNAASNGAVSHHAGLKITEVMTDNASAIPDEAGRFGDWIELTNTNDYALNLKNVGLSDRSDRIVFLFPDKVLQPGERLVIFADGVNKDDPQNVLHAKFKLSSLGEAVFLYDENGLCIDSVKVPTLNVDEAYILRDSGEWEKTELYSPGFENTAQGHEQYMKQYTVTPGMLMINEVCPSPRSGIKDEDGDCSDWVELFNLSDEDILLGNIALSDDETKPIKWIFPQDAVIPANGYYLVFCSGKNKVESGTLFPHTNFSINNESETLVLTTLSGELLDRVTVMNVERDMSYGRNPDTLQWETFVMGTPGTINNDAGISKADNYLRAINPYGVWISEVMTSADAVKAAATLSACDYIELYNASGQIVDLSGWGLSDSINWPHKWSFPAGATIYPGEYKVILANKSNSSAGFLQTSFGLTRAGGEMVTLSDAEGNILDRLYLPEIPTDVSYGRTLGSSGFFYYDTPTPGANNTTGFKGYAAAPTFETASGLYYGTIDVTINIPEGTTVRYTTDGSIPTLENGTLYIEPVTITATTIFRARAFTGGLQPSSTATASYIMNTYHTLDVVSLVCDPAELWDDQTGLLSESPDLTKCVEVNKSKIPFRTPVYRNWGKIARPGYFELFSQETHEAVLSQGIKMDLMGDYSLDMPQKSFKLRAQAQYGEKYFNAALFDSRDYTYYKSLALRNSGNDCVFTRVSDGVQTQLVDEYLDVDMVTLAWKPVVVYLNGEYWGHYNLRERKDRFSIAQYEGLDLEDDETLDNITILRANYSTVQGSNEEYRAMLKKFQTISPNTNEDDRNYLDDNIDVNNYLDWFSVKMFFGDSDPGNIMFYRIPGGKWKCLLFDLDYGLYQAQFNSPWSYLKEVGMGEQKITNIIFRKILEVDEYRDLFLRKFGSVFQTLTSEVMIDMLNRCTAIIEPELPIHYARWAEYKEPTINSDSPTTADGYLRYWNTRVNRMKNTMNWRPYYLWGFIKEQFGLTGEETTYYLGERPEKRD